MPEYFVIGAGPLWVVMEALRTHPVARALVILDGLQQVQVTPAPAPPVEPQPAAAEAPAAPTPAATSTKGRKAR